MSESKHRVEDFLDHCRIGRGMTPHTLQAYRSDLQRFVDFLGRKGLIRPADVKPANIVEYKAEMLEAPGGRVRAKGLAPATVARRLAAVSSYYDYLRSMGDGTLSNPVAPVSLRTKRNNKPKPIEPTRVEALIAGTESKRDRLIFRLFLVTGLRVSELAQLNRDSIVIEKLNRPNGSSVYQGRGIVVGKGGKQRTFHVTADVLKDLVAYRQSREDDEKALFLSIRRCRMSVRAIQERLTHWCKELGLTHTRVHQFRHTFATRALRGDMDVLHLRELMGHESIATTMQYAEVADESIAAGYFAAMEVGRL